MSKKVETNNKPTPFHEGEIFLQEKTGKTEMIEKFGLHAIRDHMPDQHREFYENLPFIVVGSVDEQGWPWATILAGKPGFINTPDDKTLKINAKAASGDPINEALKVGSPLGFLGIETTTRRRNRLNARINTVSDSQISVKVDQSFGNCPQYIQSRELEFKYFEGANIKDDKEFNEINEQLETLITNSDTFYVSSYINTKDRPDKEGVDVSHRGGNPGFVKVEGNTLTIPDFSGNYLFNTIGNFLVNPKGGLLFIDYEKGDLYLLTGTVELILEDLDEHILAFEGAQRGWKFTLDHGKILRGGYPFKTKFKDFSPNTLLTGSWKESEERVQLQEKRNVWTNYQVTEIVDESSTIKSFYLKPVIKQVLFPFEAGQYLTIKLKPEKEVPETTRTYTVSSSPSDEFYRISVKREDDGMVSNYLHNNLKVGDVIQAKAPKGEFFIDVKESRPAVFIAGGVGITPLMSMAEHVANEQLRSRNNRNLIVFYGARNTKERAFNEALKKLELKTNGMIKYYSFVSESHEGQKAGVDFNGTGRITADVLRQGLTLDDYDFYLCGPPGFMQAMYNSIKLLGVNDLRVHAESFGQASIKREPDTPKGSPAIDEADMAVIKFNKSGFEQRWNAGDKTILETAEEHGLKPNFSCRNGVCGSCAVKLKAGKVVYRKKPTTSYKEDEVLICCAVPKKGTSKLEINL